MADPKSGQEGSTTLSPIACESCRQRKRGCDRRLPYCLQCHREPSKCHYPEKSKRGIPFGYLTKLESRLAETEAALFRTLASIVDSRSLDSAMSGPSPSSSSWTPRQNKVDRVKEWDSMPLQSKDNLYAWYQSKASGPDDKGGEDEMSVIDPMLAVGASPQPSTTASPIPEESMMDITQFAAAQAAFGSSEDALQGYAGPVNVGMGLSKAESLAKSRENLYF